MINEKNILSRLRVRYDSPIHGLNTSNRAAAGTRVVNCPGYFLLPDATHVPENISYVFSPNGLPVNCSV